MQSTVGKESCNRTALKRCTSTEMRWYNWSLLIPRCSEKSLSQSSSTGCWLRCWKHQGSATAILLLELEIINKLLRQRVYVAWHGHRADTRDWQTYNHHHRGHQGKHTLVPTPVRGSSNGKCAILPELGAYNHWMKRPCSHLHWLNFNIHAYRLRAGVHKK